MLKKYLFIVILVVFTGCASNQPIVNETINGAVQGFVDGVNKTMDKTIQNILIK